MDDARPGLLRRLAARLSPCLFGLALIAFLLPFASVSCATPRGYGSAGGGVTSTYRGITLVTGGMPELTAPENAPPPAGPVAEDYVPPQPLAVGAAVLTIVGLALALWPNLAARPRALKAAVSGAGAALCTGLALLMLDRDMTARIVSRLTSAGSGGLADADVGKFIAPGIGFWATLALLTLATLLNAALALPARRRADLSSPDRAPARAPTATTADSPEQLRAA